MSTPMTDLDLAAIEARAEAPFEGPWEADDHGALAEKVRADLEAVGILPWTNGGNRIIQTVTEYVAGFRRLTVTPEMIEAVPALIAEVRRLRALNKEDYSE